MGGRFMPWNVKHFGLCVPTPLYHLYPRGNFPSFHPETIIQKKKKNLWAKCLVKKKKNCMCIFPFTIILYILFLTIYLGASQVALVAKNLPANARDIRNEGSSLPGLRRSPEVMATHSSILAWRIPMDRGAWRATVHWVTKSQI